ncbi:MAG: S9 family peptidase [Clostridia bacterium]|nr:S9 family peptidase [Clostridia bacterium]
MKQLKLNSFFDYRFLSELNYSPDGDKAAAVISKADPDSNSYVSSIYLYKSGDWKRLTAMDKERGYVWEDNDHILFPAVRTENDKKETEKDGPTTVFYRISTEGGEAERAFSLPLNVRRLERIDKKRWLVAGMVDPCFPDLYKAGEDARKEYMEREKKNADYEVLTSIPFYSNGGGYIKGRRTGLFIYDTETCGLIRFTVPLMDAESFAVSEGRIFYSGFETGEVMEALRSNLYAYDIGTGKTTTLLELPCSIYDVTVYDGKLIILAESGSKYHISAEPKFYKVDTESGHYELFSDNYDSVGNSVGSDSRLGATHQIRTKKDGIYFIKTVRNDSVISKIDAEGKVTDVVKKAGSADDFDVNGNGDIILTGMYDGKLQEVYKAKDRIEQISSFNEEVLKDTYTASFNKMTVMSEGLDIDGWVLLPKDYDEKKSYPAILDIHGGPRTVYGEVFFHEMQFWANRGYFVFFCNPKGSSGRGLEFADITDEYGKTDFKNIMDFTDAVLERYPQIDKKRVGCTGGSYGGFMSNWILGHTDRFAAIATQRSISNWISFYGMSDIGYFFGKNQLAHDIYTDEGLKRLWDQSPLKYINDMKTPTLFIHSNEDYRCPLEQGMQLFTALKEKGVPARFCMFKGENHELSRSGKPLHRERRLKEITDWMDKYLKAE